MILTVARQPVAPFELSWSLALPSTSKRKYWMTGGLPSLRPRFAFKRKLESTEVYGCSAYGWFIVGWVRR